MSLKRLLVGSATISSMKDAAKSVLANALTKESSANSSELGKQAQPLKKGAIGK